MDRASNGQKRRSGLTGAGYLAASQRPLPILVFLLPMIVLYELGTLLYLTDHGRGVVETIRAHSIILGFFQDFGVAGRFLPALALITVLLVWQAIRRDPWRVSAPVVAGLAIESAVWTAPLLVFSGLLRAMAPSAGLAGMQQVELTEMTWQARLTIALGAGLYEELLFRMIGMTAAHALVVDVLRRSDSTGRWLAVGLTAVAFAMYHEVGPAAGGPAIDWSLLVLFLGAGVFLGWLYLWRGLGVVVGVHAIYDALVLVILPALRDGS